MQDEALSSNATATDSDVEILKTLSISLEVYLAVAVRGRILTNRNCELAMQKLTKYSAKKFTNNLQKMSNYVANVRYKRLSLRSQ